MRPREKRAASLLSGKVLRYSSKALRIPKIRSGCLFSMHNSLKALRRTVAWGSSCVSTIPSMLCMVGMPSGVFMRTFFVEMRCIMAYRVWGRDNSTGTGREDGRVRFQQSRRAMKIK